MHLLRSIGLQLNDKPTLPVDKSKHAKGYVARNADDDSEWKEYWYEIKKICSFMSFVRCLSMILCYEYLCCFCDSCYAHKWSSYVLSI